MTTIQHNLQRAQHAVSHASFKRVISALTIGVSVLFALYVYLVGALTFSVITQKNIQQQVKNTTSEMSRVELAYLAQEKSLTKEYAKSIGFVENPTIAYTDSTHGLALNTN